MMVEKRQRLIDKVAGHCRRKHPGWTLRQCYFVAKLLLNKQSA
jgi:hypothetical protein